MKILIVDDRSDNRLLLREQLRGFDAETVAAESGVRALHELRSQSFDLVVTDLLMPEMDGFQLCYLLKTDPQLKRTPVVIYTANYVTRKDEEEAKNLGADDFITRPIDEEQLSQRILAVLERAHSGLIAEPRRKPDEGFIREYSTLLIQKLEDQLITAEENARLLMRNAELAREVEAKNAQLQQTNEDLLRANQDLEAFTYTVSHDLRAPVRAIKGMIELLTEELGAALTPGAREFINRINYNADRMNALITGLHAHSRMQNLDTAVLAVDLNRVVDSALAGLEFAIAAAGARITVERPLPVVLGHEQALVQILTNLVDNAMKFVAPGVTPAITIHAHAEGRRVRVTVRDNGVGIAPQYQHRIYKAFERLHPESKYPGTGLGLAIVRRGVEKMGGSVGLESAPNQGSTFWLVLNAP